MPDVREQILYGERFTWAALFRCTLTFPIVLPLALFLLLAYRIEHDWDVVSRLIEWSVEPSRKRAE